MALKKEMRLFVGCQVGEQHLGRLASMNQDSYQKLVKNGYLTAETKENRIWYALTEKGKAHVRLREIALAQW